jgi:hypothetical protein
MRHTYTSNMFFDSTFTGYDKAEFSADIDELNKKEEVIMFEDYDEVTETLVLDTETMEVVEVIVDVELLDPDHYDTDPEYERVLGMYADEYGTEIALVDNIDTEDEFPWSTY